jgi:isoleucyl-tRNA synthetase
MRIASMGRAARAKAGLKVRQPLADVAVLTRNPQEAEALGPMTSQILEELNVKELKLLHTGSELYQKVMAATPGRPGAAATPGMRSVDGYLVNQEDGYLVAVNSALTDDLRDEGLARELVHRIQNLRRDAGFEITDRIVTYYQGPAEVDRVMRRHADYVQQETLSEALVAGPPADGASAEAQKVEGMEVTLGVKRL